MVRFLNQTPRFDRYVIQRGSKSKHREDTRLQEFELYLQIIIHALHSKVKMIEKTYMSS